MSEEVNPLRKIIYNNKNIISNQSNQSNQLERKNNSFYILPNIAQGFRTYARFSGRSVGECVEEAFLEYMKNHPTDQVTLNLTVDMNNFIMDLNSRLQLRLLKNDLENCLSVVERLSKMDNRNHEIQKQFKRLQKLIKKAIPFSHYPDIRGILEKAEDYI